MLTTDSIKRICHKENAQMALIPPQLKLAFTFATMLREYGPILAHLNKPELLTKDLGDAMRDQKRALSDPGKGVIMTASEVFPIIVKVKVLSTLVANKLGIDSKGKSAIAVLEEIVQKSDENGNAHFAKGIKDTLGWTRALFADPDIQAVLKMPMTEIESPNLTVKGVGKFIMSLAGRSQDEFIRVQEFLKAAKDIKEPTATQPPAPTATPAATTPVNEDKKPSDTKPVPPKASTPPTP